MALGLALVAIILVVWFAQPAHEGIATTGQTNVEQSQNNDVSQLVAAIREFNPWADTYAQWLMAFFGMLATGVSIWAVILIRKTLREAQATTKAALESSAAVREANAIMREEQRPWISIHFNEFMDLSVDDVSKPDDDGVVLGQWQIVLENFGASPAKNVRVWHDATPDRDRIGRPRKALEDLMVLIDQHKISAVESRSYVVFPGEKIYSKAQAILMPFTGPLRVFHMYIVALYDVDAGAQRGIDARVFGVSIDTEGNPIVEDLSDVRITE